MRVVVEADFGTTKEPCRRKALLDTASSMSWYVYGRGGERDLDGRGASADVEQGRPSTDIRDLEVSPTRLPLQASPGAEVDVEGEVVDPGMSRGDGKKKVVIEKHPLVSLCYVDGGKTPPGFLFADVLRAPREKSVKNVRGPVGEKPTSGSWGVMDMELKQNETRTPLVAVPKPVKGIRALLALGLRRHVPGGMHFRWLPESTPLLLPEQFAAHRRNAIAATCQQSDTTKVGSCRATWLGRVPSVFSLQLTAQDGTWKDVGAVLVANAAPDPAHVVRFRIAHHVDYADYAAAPSAVGRAAAAASRAPLPLFADFVEAFSRTEVPQQSSERNQWKKWGVGVEKKAKLWGPRSSNHRHLKQMVEALKDALRSARNRRRVDHPDTNGTTPPMPQAEFLRGELHAGGRANHRLERLLVRGIATAAAEAVNGSAKQQGNETSEHMSKLVRRDLDFRSQFWALYVTRIQIGQTIIDARQDVFGEDTPAGNEMRAESGAEAQKQKHSTHDRLNAVFLPEWDWTLDRGSDLLTRSSHQFPKHKLVRNVYTAEDGYSEDQVQRAYDGDTSKRHLDTDAQSKRYLATFDTGASMVNLTRPLYALFERQMAKVSNECERGPVVGFEVEEQEARTTLTDRQEARENVVDAGVYFAPVVERKTKQKHWYFLHPKDYCYCKGLPIGAGVEQKWCFDELPGGERTALLLGLPFFRAHYVGHDVEQREMLLPRVV